MEATSFRKYRIADADLWILAHNQLRLYKKHSEELKAFNPTLFSETFATNLQQKMDRTVEISKDSSYRLSQTEATNLVSEKREECYEKISLASYYVKVSGRKDREFVRKFQLGRVTKARINTGEMLLFLDDFLHDLTNSRARLVKVGFPRELIDTIRILRRELGDLRQKQEDAVEERRLARIERIELNNSIWEDLVELAQVAPFAFPNDDHIQEKFKLPKQKRKSSQ